MAEYAKTYTEQAFRVLDPKKTRVRYNGEWLSKLTLLDLIRLGQNFTVQQFLARDNFAKRLENEEPIYLHETFYSLMQGYDAVAQQTDVQVGGTDQLFNIIVAGTEAAGGPGSEAARRDHHRNTARNGRRADACPSPSGNVVPINSGAEDMYGKLMSIPDFAMEKYMRLVTRWMPREIDELMASMQDRRSPPARRQDEDGARDHERFLRR